MRKLVQSAVLFGILVVACKKEDETPAQNPQQQGQYGYAQGQQPQGQQQGYPQGQQQQGYPQQQYPQQTQTAPTGTTAPAGGQMAVPNQLALPCSNDSGCGLARCNTQYGKCAFPCVSSEHDCISGAACGVGGLCMPGGK